MTFLCNALALISLIFLACAVPTGLLVSVLRPLSVARFIPRRYRAGLVADGSRIGFASAAGLAVGLVGGATGTVMYAHNPWTERVTASMALLAAAGVPTVVAAWLAARAGAPHWAAYGTHHSQKSLLRLSRSLVRLPTPGLLLPIAAPSGSGTDVRPASHAVDRQLRGLNRTLIGAFGLWWLGSNMLQALIGKTPLVGGGLLTIGAALTVVWVLRLARRHTARFAQGTALGIAAITSVCESMGLRVQLPAGPWVRAIAPAAFVSHDAGAPHLPWPWAGVADVGDGRTIVLAHHEGARPNRFAGGRVSRTVCVVRVPGARLPTVIVTAREGVRLRDLQHAVSLESEAFNRSLWVSGAEEAGVYAVVHARSMAEMLRRLPDGATAIFDRDYVAVYTDEQVLPAMLRDYASAALTIADLIPTYLLSPVAHPGMREPALGE